MKQSSNICKPTFLTLNLTHKANKLNQDRQVSSNLCLSLTLGSFWSFQDISFLKH